jgi:hypothetical protein
VRGTPVDIAVTLPDGTAVNGAAELARHLAADPAFTHCAAQLLLTYAVGRGFDSPEAKRYAGALADPGNANSNNDYGFLFGSSAPHHALSAHGGNPEVLAKLTTIDLWEISRVADLLSGLDAIVESDGTTVLDNTTFYLGSDVGDGQAKNHWDQPVLLAGGASGKLKIDGLHLNYIPTMPFPRPLVGPRGGPHTGRVFLAILAAHGLPSAVFGQATGGPLPELLP